jgi:hypothetical protein
LAELFQGPSCAVRPTGAKVRAIWMSDDTRARITAFIDALARD